MLWHAASASCRVSLEQCRHTRRYGHATHFPVCLAKGDGASCAELLLTLKRDLWGLETLLKSMDDYLETKRLAFPRLYFLSMAELVELMCKKDHNAVQVCLML